MGVESILNLKTTFDLATNPCRFIFEDLGDYSSLGILSSDVKGDLIVTGPTGIIHSNTSWTTPDITLATSAIFDSVLIPVGTNGKHYPGTYSIQYTARISGATLPGDYSYTNTFDYAYETPIFKDAWVNNPYNTYLGVTDVTPYVVLGSSPLKTYLNTLKFPPIYGYQDIVSTSFRIAITNPFYVDGAYTNIVSVSLSYAFASYAVLDTLLGESTFIVTDTTRIQDVYCCVKNLGKKMLRAKDNEALSAKYTKTFSQATGLLELMQQAITLGQYSDADSYIEEIYCVTGCSRGCSCSGNLISQIQPYSSQTNAPGQAPSDSDFEIGDFKATTRSTVGLVWRFAIGQLELQSDYPDLYAIIGNQFNVGGEPGGYFRFPDTRSRVLMGAGQGSGLTNRVFASKVGADFWQGSHSHSVSGTLQSTGSATPDSQLTIDLDGAILVDDFTVNSTGSIDLPVPEGTASILFDGTTDSTTGLIVDFANANNHTDTISEAAPHDHSVSVSLSGTTNTTSGLAVDFTNISNHTDTVSEGSPHSHAVTTTPKGGLFGDDNTFALDDTYTTTGHTVSINLDLAHSGSQNIDHNHNVSLSGDFTTGGHTVSIDLDLAHSGNQNIDHSHDFSINATGPVATPNITGGISVSGDVSGLGGVCHIGPTNLTLPDYSVDVSGDIDLTTSSTQITVQTVTPSLVVRFAIKVV